MTRREGLDRWLADTEWAEIGGGGGDAMRCRPLGADCAESGPWIPDIARARIRTFEAMPLDRTLAISSVLERQSTPADEPGGAGEPSCPVHGPALAGICWRCTERLGSRFTAVATVDPDTGLLAFLGVEATAEPGA